MSTVKMAAKFEILSLYIAAVIRTTSGAAASMTSVATTKVVFGNNNPSTRHPIQTSLISSQPVSLFPDLLVVGRLNNRPTK